MARKTVSIDPDFCAGVLFSALGAHFSIRSLQTLAFGTAFRMGPGFFPTIVGGLLLVIGLVILIRSLMSGSAKVEVVIPWGEVVLIPAGLVLFGAVMRPPGLLPALLILCFMSAVATHGLAVARAGLTALAMTIACIAIFSFGLGMDLPLLGDWLDRRGMDLFANLALGFSVALAAIQFAFSSFSIRPRSRIRNRDACPAGSRQCRRLGDLARDLPRRRGSRESAS